MNPRTILVVEDNPITRKMMRVTLESEGYRVLEAPDGREALSLAAQHPPDMILQDLHLPDMDGFELLRRLREIPGGRQVPILAVSGFASKPEEGRVKAVGFDDIVIKPVEPSRLLLVIRGFLPPKEPERQGPGRNRRVLVADDDAIQRKLLALQLRSLGFLVEVAGDGAEALERARADPPAAIASDVFMPRLDGFGLCLAVRRDPRLSCVPVVLFSSMYVEEGDRSLGRNVGANAWVDRSPDFKEVVEALVASLAGSAPAPAVEFTDRTMADYTERLIRQLERQAALNAGLAQRSALLAAELSVLSGIADALARAEDVEATLPGILHRSLDAGGLSRGALYLTGSDGRPVLNARMGYEDIPVAEVEGFFGHADFLERVIEAGDPVVIPSAAVPEPIAVAILDRSKGTHSLIAPISSHGVPLGAVLMGSSSRTLTQEDWILSARTMATQIGQAIALSRMFSQVALSEQRLQHLLVSSPTVVHSFRVEGGAFIRTSVSENIARLLGHEVREVEAAPTWWADHLHPDDRAAALSGRAALLAQGHLVHEYRFRHKDGSYRWIHDELRLLRDAEGRPVEVVAAWSDITERKQAEEGERVREAAEAANRAKSEFLSRMSHELRTPLNAVLGFAQLLQLEAQTPEQRESVEHILKGGRHLLNLINEVLDITRIETGGLYLSSEPVPVADLLRESLDLIRPLMDQRHIRFNLEEPTEDRHVLADRQRLKQILLNLLANAVKYNREGGAVTVACEAAPGDRLRIRVSDTGPGIPPALLERLFMPFDRLGAEQSGVEGTGLGLALSKRLVEAMGGAVGVESTVGEGSTFWVELPLAEAPVGRLEGAPAEVLPAAGPPTPAATVLYIEDNLSNLRLIERVLAQRPAVKVLPAMQGRLGLDLAREHHPDLILLDLHLPDLPGHEVLRHLQGDARTRDIPVIVISADATPGQVDRLKASGARAYLTKPLDVKQLLALLDETLGERAAI